MVKTVSTIAFPLITFPYVSRVLHPEFIGRINFGNSIVSYFTLIATLGVTTYAIRECARIRNDKDKLSETVSQIFSINVCTMIVSYVLLVFCLALAPALEGYQSLIALQASTILFTVIGADWMNTAMEDFKFITIRTVFFQIISLVFMFLFVRKPEDYYIYALITVIASGGASLSNIIYRRRYCKVRFTFHVDWRRHFPPILLLFTMLVSQTVMNNIDATMLGIMKGDEDVGLYSTAVKVIAIAAQIVTSITWVLLPQLSEAFILRNVEKRNRLIGKAISFTILLGLPLVVGINMLAGEIILIVGGEEYYRASVCLNILTISMVFSLASNVSGNLILLASGKDKQFAAACIFGMVLNIPANLVAIPIFGIEGAAASTIVAQAAIFIATLFFIPRRMGLNIQKNIVGSAIVGSVSIVAISLVIGLFGLVFWVKAIVVVFLGFVAYCLALLLCKNEIALNFARSVFMKFKK